MGKFEPYLENPNRLAVEFEPYFIVPGRLAAAITGAAASAISIQRVSDSSSICRAIGQRG